MRYVIDCVAVQWDVVLLGGGLYFPLPLDTGLSCVTYFSQENVSTGDMCHIQVEALRANVYFSLFSFFSATNIALTIQVLHPSGF